MTEPETTTPAPLEGIIPGVTIEVVAPNRPGAFLKAPWLLIDGPAGSSLSSPPLDRESSAALRILADQVDAAWAKLDRAAALAGQPEDTTDFTGLGARTPVCPLDAALQHQLGEG